MTKAISTPPTFDLMDELNAPLTNIAAIAAGMKCIALQAFEKGASMDDQNALCCMVNMVNAEIRTVESMVFDGIADIKKKEAKE